MKQSPLARFALPGKRTAAALRLLMACAVTAGSTEVPASTSRVALLWVLPAAEAGRLLALLPSPAPAQTAVATQQQKQRHCVCHNI